MGLTVIVLHILHERDLASHINVLAEGIHKLRSSTHTKLGFNDEHFHKSVYRARFAKLYTRVIRMSSAVALYYTLRRTFVGFDNALRIPAKKYDEHGNYTEPFSFWAGVTVVASIGIVAIHYYKALVKYNIVKKHKEIKQEYHTPATQMTDPRFKRVLIAVEEQFMLAETYCMYISGKV